MVFGPEEGVIVFAEADALALEFAGDEVMAIEVVGGLEGQKGADALIQKLNALR